MRKMHHMNAPSAEIAKITQNELSNLQFTPNESSKLADFKNGLKLGIIYKGGLTICGKRII